MGYAIIMGSGSGKPVNSVKVTEVAGENIPANCFVQKLEGSSIETLKSFQGSTVYSGLKGIWMDNEVFVACHAYLASSDSAAYNHIMTFKNTTSVNDLKLAQYSSSSELIPWVVMKGSRQVLLGYSQIHHLYSDANVDDVLAVKVDDDGVVTKELESYTWQSQGSVGSIVVGTYNEDFFYSYSAESTSSTTVSIYKNTCSSAGIQTTLFKTLTLGQALYNITPSVYIPELNWIIFAPRNSGSAESYRKYAAYDITNDEWVVNCTTTVNVKTYFDELALFSGKALILPKNKRLVVSTNNWARIETVDLSTGEYIAVEIDNPTERKYIKMLGTVEENGHPETTLLCLETTSNGISDDVWVSLFDILTSTTTHLSQIRYQTQYFVNNNQFLTKYRGRNRFWMHESYNYTSSTAYGRYSLNDFSFAHVEIYSGKPIYGVSASATKTGKEAAVYVADSAYADAMYTTYGITEALAAQIIDDSVDEIKQEVTM